MKRLFFVVTIFILSFSSVYSKSLPTEYIIEDVPIISQLPELPTGCEATALTMLLNYSGQSITKIEVANNMPKSSLPYYKDGKVIGPNPSEFFIGNPFDEHSYGIYHEPIVDMIENYLPNRSLNLTGKSFDDILKVVAKGNPVMVWASKNMTELSYKSDWQFEDGTPFNWPGNEHVMVIIGFNENNIIINDPYTGRRQYYNKDTFIHRWTELGKQGVSIKNTNTLQTPDNLLIPSPSTIISPNNPTITTQPIITVNPTQGDLLNTFIENNDTSSLEYRNTVLRFQAENNLSVDGIVGPCTKRALESNHIHIEDIIPNAQKNKDWFITLNKSTKILTVYHLGNIYKKYPVAIGKQSTPTPNHKFTIINKLVNPYWGGMGGKYTPIKGGSPRNPLGTRWMGLSTKKYRGYGIHGNSNPWSIGKYISSGCTRMINEDVVELFEYIPQGTEVWIGDEQTLGKWGITQ